MPLVTYKLIHIVGVVVLFTALGGITAARPGSGGHHERLPAALHGLALLVILVSGFGALARIGMSGGVPVWVWLKGAIWLALGAGVALLRRWPAAGGWMYILWPALGAAAVALALFKPGAPG